MQKLRVVILAGLFVLILGAGFSGLRLLVAFGPRAPKVAPERRLEKVEVVPVVVVNVPVMLSAQGTVEPLRRTELSTEVAGRLISVDPRFNAGEVFREGERFAQIDPSDYRAVLAEAQSGLAEARLNLQLEEARAVQAIRDWKKLRTWVDGSSGNGEPDDLVLRKPHLASAGARVAAAEQRVMQAETDLGRTDITAPYHCRIQRTGVDLGAVVVPGMALLEVVATGPVEVRLPLSLEDFGFLARDANGQVRGAVTARARIGGEWREWIGSLVRSEEIVDPDTQTIHVVAEFGRDGEETPPVGVFLETSIAGREVKDVVVVDRAVMVSPREVLVVTAKDGKDVLEMREVSVLRTEVESALIAGGLAPGDRVLTTVLAAPVPGMPVEIVETEETPPAGRAVRNEPGL